MNEYAVVAHDKIANAKVRKRLFRGKHRIDIEIPMFGIGVVRTTLPYEEVRKVLLPLGFDVFYTLDDYYQAGESNG